MPDYHVYIVTNKHRTVLYTGMTNDLSRRAEEHAAGIDSVFSATYRTKFLIYAESHPTAADAIRREKQIKGWRREKKLALIRTLNPDLLTLNDSAFFADDGGPSTGSG